jgi:hypothetical protein
MAIRFKYDGIEFEVSTPKEAAQVVRELRRHQPLEAFTNPYARLTVQRKIDLSEPASGEARQFRHYEASKEPVAKVRESIAALEESVRNAVQETTDRVTMTHTFLTALRVKPVMNAQEVGAVLKINHPKGLGPRSMLINNTLLRFGFDPETVYTNSERSAQGRVWKAGPKLDEAIARFDVKQQELKEVMFS